MSTHVFEAGWKGVFGLEKRKLRRKDKFLQKGKGFCFLVCCFVSHLKLIQQYTRFLEKG